NITSGTDRNIFFPATLSVFFRPGDKGVGVYNSALGEVSVYDTADGNDQGGSPQLLSGTKVGQWNNYAVLFDRAAGTLAIYVNQALLKRLDLRQFAGGRYLSYSNKAVVVGAAGDDRTWMDNFQVGAPYVGYQVNAAGNSQTGYDFGVKDAKSNTGALQGVVVDSSGQGIAGITMFLDNDGDGQVSPGEPQTTTDVHGSYRFTGLKPGTYLVRQALPGGCQQLQPSDYNDPAPPISVDVLGGQTSYANNFTDTGSCQSLSTAHQQVQALYRPVLGREADAGGLSAWVQFLKGGGSRAQLVRAFWESAEHRGLQVDQFYATHLRRPADAAGRAHWVAALRAGQSEEA